MTCKNDWHIFFALIWRDYISFKQRVFSMLIDSSFIVLSQLFLMLFMFPRLGMPESLVPPLFLGTATFFVLMSLGYRQFMFIAKDIEYGNGGELTHSLALPIRPTLVVTALIIKFIIEAVIVTVPLLFCGILVLGDRLLLALAPNASFTLFFLMQLLMILFFGTFFLATILCNSFEWYLNNVWTRRLNGMFFLSAHLVTWYQVLGYSPVWAYLFLLNPATYLCEGLRSALLGSDQYIHPGICIAVTISIIFINCYRIKNGLIKKLDPVWNYS